MLFRLSSDIHMEFHYNMRFDINEFIPPLPSDEDTVLILAGDVGTTKAYFWDAIAELERFKDIIIIMGNHEHYKHNYHHTLSTLKNSLDDYSKRLSHRYNFDNIHLLDNETLVIDDVVFICSQLWTSFDNENIDVMEYSRHAMSDFSIITAGPENIKFSPEIALSEYKKNIAFIEKELIKANKNKQKSVVVTHHGPSFKSVHPRFHGSLLNGAFTNKLDDFVLKHKPNYWCHGHTHEYVDYKIGEGRVIANPVGYPGEDRVTPYDPNLLIEL